MNKRKNNIKIVDEDNIANNNNKQKLKVKKIIFNCDYNQFSKDTEILFNDINILIGENGVGKSTILNLINLLFTNDNLKYIDTNKKQISIFVEFEESIYKRLIYNSLFFLCLSKITDDVNMYDINKEHIKNYIDKMFNILNKDGIEFGIDYELNYDCYWILPEKELIENLINIFSTNDGILGNVNIMKYIKLNFFNDIYSLCDFPDIRNNFISVMNIMKEITNSVNYIDNKIIDNYISSIINDIISDSHNKMTFNYNTIYRQSQKIKCFNVLENNDIFTKVHNIYDKLTGKKFKIINKQSSFFDINYFKNNNEDMTHDNTIISQKKYQKNNKAYTNNFNNRSSVYFHNDMCIVIGAQYINDNEGECSFGEIELIEFLTLFYSNENKILLLDEPLVHLSTGIIQKFFDDYVITNNEKQIFMITHDPRKLTLKIMDNIIFMPKDKNIMTFSKIYDELNKTLKNQLSQYQVKKEIFENKNILFEKDIILVEGYDDYAVISELCRMTGEQKFILATNGCTKPIHKIIKILNIKYKTIFDLNVLFNCFGEKDIKEIYKTGNFIKNNKDNNIIIYHINDKIKQYLKKEYLNICDCNEEYTFNDIDKYLKQLYTKLKNVYFHNQSIINIEGLFGVDGKFNDSNNSDDIEKYIIANEVKFELLKNFLTN